MNQNSRFNKLVILAALVFGISASAFAVGPDMTAVTDGMGGLTTSVLAAAATIITAALGLYAIKKGGVWLKRLWGSFSS